jgi:putative N6-adenine-specific DNA methylase
MHDRSDMLDLAAARLSVQKACDKARITPLQVDFFELDPGDLPPSPPGLVVLNPPYGRRLGTPSESRGLMGAVMARLHDRYGGWRFVLVAPASVRPAGLPAGTAAHPVFHGGLNVNFWIGRIG